MTIRNAQLDYAAFVTAPLAVSARPGAHSSVRMRCAHMSMAGTKVLSARRPCPASAGKRARMLRRAAPGERAFVEARLVG